MLPNQSSLPITEKTNVKQISWNYKIQGVTWIFFNKEIMFFPWEIKSSTNSYRGNTYLNLGPVHTYPDKFENG